MYIESVAPLISTLFTFHWYVNPAPVFAFNVTPLPLHTVSAPCAVTVAFGVLTVTGIMFDALVQPKALATTAK